MDVQTVGAGKDRSLPGSFLREYSGSFLREYSWNQYLIGEDLLPQPKPEVEVMNNSDNDGQFRWVLRLPTLENPDPTRRVEVEPGPRVRSLVGLGSKTCREVFVLDVTSTSRTETRHVYPQIICKQPSLPQNTVYRMGPKEESQILLKTLTVFIMYTPSH